MTEIKLTFQEAETTLCYLIEVRNKEIMGHDLFEKLLLINFKTRYSIALNVRKSPFDFPLLCWYHHKDFILCDPTRSNRIENILEHP